MPFSRPSQLFSLSLLSSSFEGMLERARRKHYNWRLRLNDGIDRWTIYCWTLLLNHSRSRICKSKNSTKLSCLFSPHSLLTRCLLSFERITEESREETHRFMDSRLSKKEKGVQVQEIVIDDTQQKLEELTRSFREMQRDLNIIKCLLQSLL